MSHAGLLDKRGRELVNAAALDAADIARNCGMANPRAVLTARG